MSTSTDPKSTPDPATGDTPAAAPSADTPESTAATAPQTDPFEAALESDILDTSAITSEAGPATGDPGGPPLISPEQLKSMVDQLLEENEKLHAELKAIGLRHIADLDNLRKRLERDKDDAAKYAISKFSRDLVGVADNFERALAAVPQGAADADPALKNLVEGIDMTERELITVLERHGVKRENPKGESFNPHRHQAVMEKPDPSVPNGTVLEVFQCGYSIEDRVLRPAMVVVAKGGPKTGKVSESGNAEPTVPPSKDETA